MSHANAELAANLDKANDLIALLSQRWSMAETKALQGEVALAAAQRRIQELEAKVAELTAAAPLSAAPDRAQPPHSPQPNGVAAEAVAH